MNPLLNFLRENLQRLFIKMPKFFKVWGWISTALLLITSLPAFVTMLPLGITIPDLWNNYITLAVRYAASGMLLMSLLTAQSKPVAVTTGGDILKKTDETKLPFTAASEQKAVLKADDIVEIKNIPKTKSI